MISGPKKSEQGQLDVLVDQLCAMIQTGEDIDIDRLAKENPEYSNQLRELYPTLVALTTFDDATDSIGSAGGEAGREHFQTLGDFRLVRQIGRGGMGVVYEAEQQTIRRRVALKILPLAALVDPRALQRFKNEVTAIATLEHPHIVSVYAIGEERGIHYFAMQLIRGQSLATVIAELRARTEQEGSVTGASLNQVVSDLEDDEKKESGLSGAQHPQSRPDEGILTPEKTSEKTGSGLFGAQHPQGRPGQRDPTPFSNDELDETAAIETQARGRSKTAPGKVTDPVYFRNVSRLILQAADALQHAHDHGIVHRDVKPGNLLLDAAGNLFVTDFGLARIETGAGVTMTGDVLGTLRYMSPEQVLAGRVLVDHRTDLYSLGATLFELLTLQPMWTGDNRADVIHKISFEEPIRPQKLNSSIPTDLETIALKAIRKNPVERYETAQAFADDLQQYLGNKPIKARRATLTEKLTKWSLRHKSIVASALVALLLVAVTSTVAAVMIWNAGQLRQEALLDKQNALEQVAAAERQTSAVHGFVLNEILKSAMPSKKGARHITVHESILSANQQVNDVFQDDPLMHAHVQSKFGDYLKEIGEYELARQSLESAVDRFTRLHGMNHIETIRTSRKLIRVYWELGEFDLAVTTAQAVVRRSQEFLDAVDRQTVNNMWQLGVALGKNKQFDDAMEILNEVVDLSRTEKIPLFEALATNELGNCSFKQLQYEAAEKYWMRALEQFQQLDTSQTNILAAKINLAKVYWETARLEKSISYTQEVFEQSSDLNGSTHPRTLSALTELASRKFNSGQSDDSLEDYQKLLAATIERHGSEHEKSAKVMRNLGTVLRDLGRFDEALERQQTALKLFKQKFGDQHANVLATLGTIGLTATRLNTTFHQEPINEI